MNGDTIQKLQDQSDGLSQRLPETAISKQISPERELTAILFHELRNYLNGILGNAQLTRASLDGLLISMDEYREVEEMQVDVTVLQRELKNLKTQVEAIETCGTDQLAVLNQALDFNKLEQAHVELELQPFALCRDVLKPLIAVYSPLSQAKNICFQVEAPGTEKWLMGDAYRLKQILTNLLSNALKFAAPVSTKSSACIQLGLSLSEAKTDQPLHFTIKNTGPGLTPSQIAQLFKPYSQTDSSIVRRFGGTGLGLAVCKQLLGLMRGEIVCRSSVDEQWVQFEIKVSLPIAEEKHSKRNSRLGEGVLRARQKKKPLNLKVLVAEDSPVNQKIAVQMLEKFSCLVDVANNGRDAVARCAEQDYALVFMDIQMPEMDGLEATRLIRAAEKTRADSALAPLPIIGLSANVFTEQQDTARQAGMTDYLTKPFSAAGLYKKLTQHARQISRDSPISSERTIASGDSTSLSSSRHSLSLFTRRTSSSTRKDSESYPSSCDLTDHPPSCVEMTSPMTIDDSVLLMPSSRDRAKFFSENQEMASLKAEVAELKRALEVAQQQQAPAPSSSEEKILIKTASKGENEPASKSKFLPGVSKPRRRHQHQQAVQRTSSFSPLLRSSSTSEGPASRDKEPERQVAETSNDAKEWGISCCTLL